MRSRLSKTPERTLPVVSPSRRPLGPLFPAVVALLLFLTAAVGAQEELPRPQGYVNDFAGVLDGRSEEQMRRLAEAVERATGAQLAVAVVETIEPYGSIEQYAIALAEAWGVGSQEEDNGVLLVLSMGERRVRMEVGYGLEKAIPDGTAGAILDDAVLPALREGRYGEGLLRGLESISAEIAEEYNVDLTRYGAAEQPRSVSSRGSGGSGGLGRLIYLLIFLFFFGGGRFFWPLLFLTGGRGLFGGGFGSGRPSGGFSGFGGGGFGGGGASRGF